MRLLLPVLLLSIAPLCAGQPLDVVTELVPSELSATASFGSAVSIDGDLALVGAVNDNRVFVFARSSEGWTEEATLSPDELDPGDSFGERVAFDGERLLVSARGDDAEAGDDVGAVYVYERSNGAWTLQAKLTASDGNPGDFFGQALDLNGDQAIITTQFGAAAYVFTYDGDAWTEEAKLTVNDAPFFGSAVALEGDLALVGSPRIGNAPDVGSIYAFERSEGVWSQTAMLAVTSDDNPDQIGDGFDYENGTLVATGFGLGASSYVFAYDGSSWTLEAEVPLPDGGPAFLSSGGGDYVDLAGDAVLIGALSVAGGAAYLFERSDGAWSLSTFVESPIEEQSVSFGRNLAFDGDRAVIGARNAEGFQGRAYVFESNTVSNEAGPADSPTIRASVYPNPAAQRATVTLALSNAAEVRVALYDMLGREVAVLRDGLLATGLHRVAFDASTLSTGVYLVRVIGDGVHAAQRVTVVR